MSHYGEVLSFETSPHLTAAEEWRKHTLEIDVAPNVRFLLVQQTSRDVEYWAGHYGSECGTVVVEFPPVLSGVFLIYVSSFVVPVFLFLFLFLFLFHFLLLCTFPPLFLSCPPSPFLNTSSHTRRLPTDGIHTHLRDNLLFLDTNFYSCFSVGTGKQHYRKGRAFFQNMPWHDLSLQSAPTGIYIKPTSGGLSRFTVEPDLDVAFAGGNSLRVSLTGLSSADVSEDVWLYEFGDRGGERAASLRVCWCVAEGDVTILPVLRVRSSEGVVEKLLHPTSSSSVSTKWSQHTHTLQAVNAIIGIGARLTLRNKTNSTGQTSVSPSFLGDVFVEWVDGVGNENDRDKKEEKDEEVAAEDHTGKVALSASPVWNIRSVEGAPRCDVILSWSEAKLPTHGGYWDILLLRSNSIKDEAKEEQDDKSDGERDWEVVGRTVNSSFVLRGIQSTSSPSSSSRVRVRSWPESSSAVLLEASVDLSAPLPRP